MEIKLYDYEDEYGYQYCIGSGNLSAGVVVPQIEAAKGQHLDIKIASVGGSFLDAVLIYHAIIEHGDVTTINQGYALSAGALIAMAGQSRKTYATSLFMIHKAMVDIWMMGQMNADDIRKEAAGLETADSIQITLLTKYTGLSEGEVNTMLSAETWLTGQEAFDKGFFTDLIELGDTQSMSARSYTGMVAKTKGKFAAVAKDNIKINDNMSTNAELLNEIKAQREENSGFWASVKTALGIKAEAETVDPPAAEPEPTEETETVDSLKAKVAALEAEKAETNEVLIEAKAALSEFKTQSAAFKTELSAIRSNYKPAAEVKDFNTKATEEAPSRFKAKK